MLHAVLLQLLFAQVLQAVLQASAERDDQSSGIMAVHPLLDFHQPGKIKQKIGGISFYQVKPHGGSWRRLFAGDDAV